MLTHYFFQPPQISAYPCTSQPLQTLGLAVLILDFAASFFSDRFLREVQP